MKKAIIVASGPSLNDLDPQQIYETSLRANAKIIAVNGAADWLTKFHMFFTLDPSKKNMERMNRQKPGVEYFCAYEFDRFYKIPNHVYKLVRVSYKGSLDNFKPNSPEWLLHRWGCKLGLNESAGHINTGNSVYGALGLLYSMKYTHIVILGLDGTQEPRVNNEGPSEYSLEHLPLLFRSAKPQLIEEGVQVVNGSIFSNITCFPRTTPDRALKWLDDVVEDE